jgi:hypothetical protein
VCPVAHCAAKPAVPPEHAPFVKVAGVEVNVPEIEPLMEKKLFAGRAAGATLCCESSLCAHPDDPKTAKPINTRAAIAIDFISTPFSKFKIVHRRCVGQKKWR